MTFKSWTNPGSSEFLAPTEEETNGTWRDYMSSIAAADDTIVSIFDGEIKIIEGNFTRGNLVLTGPDLVRAHSGI